MTEEIYSVYFGYGLDLKDPTIVEQFPWQEYKKHALSPTDAPDQEIAAFFDQRPQDWYNHEWLRTGAALGALGYFTRDPTLVRRFFDFMLQSNARVIKAVKGTTIPTRARNVITNNCDVFRIDRKDRFIDSMRVIAQQGDSILVDYTLQAMEASTEKTILVINDLERRLGPMEETSSVDDSQTSFDYLRSHRSVWDASGLVCYIQQDFMIEGEGYCDLMRRLITEAVNYARIDTTESAHEIHARARAIVNEYLRKEPTLTLRGQ